MEETYEERAERQRQTGVIGNGHTVVCHPTGDPEVVEIQHRAVCLTRPHPACVGCEHKRFNLVFDADASAKYQTVKCPRWDQETDRMRGLSPSQYIETEILTCERRPFSFCSSCPSKETLSKMYIDKEKDGWFERLKRFENEE